MFGVKLHQYTLWDFIFYSRISYIQTIKIIRVLNCTSFVSIWNNDKGDTLRYEKKFISEIANTEPIILIFYIYVRDDKSKKFKVEVI